MKTAKIIATLLAGALGLLAILAGSTVLFGLREVDYPVIRALVMYNVLAGVLSLLTAVGIWKRPGLAQGLASLILTFHAAVLGDLYFFSDTAADKSIGAMVFRVAVWSLILVLLLLRPSGKQAGKRMEKP